MAVNTMGSLNWWNKFSLPVPATLSLLSPRKVDAVIALSHTSIHPPSPPLQGGHGIWADWFIDVVSEKAYLLHVKQQAGIFVYGLASSEFGKCKSSQIIHELTDQINLQIYKAEDQTSVYKKKQRKAVSLEAQREIVILVNSLIHFSKRE